MKERNYGIDGLRIISMLLVVILHVLGNGGILENAKQFDKFMIVWLLEIGAYCAVNCYALISGFVGYSNEPKQHKYSKYVTLWIEVVVYGILMTIVCNKLYPEIVTKKDLLKAIFPVCFSQYWYFSSYTVLFFMMPYINKMVRGFSKRELLKLIGTMFLIFSVYATFIQQLQGDPFVIRAGYSFLWIAFLYIIGAYIKKYDIYINLKKKKLLIVGIVLLILTWVPKIIFGQVINLSGNISWGDLLISYTSPTILGIALVVLLIFANISVKNFTKNIIKFLAPSAFGVYIIHTQPLFYNNFLKDRFINVLELNTFIIPLAVLGIAIVIFIIGVFIDKIRIQLFKLLRMNKLSNQIVEYGKRIRDKKM